MPKKEKKAQYPRVPHDSQGKKVAKTSVLEDVEFESDAWERFEQGIERIGEDAKKRKSST